MATHQLLACVGNCPHVCTAESASSILVCHFLALQCATLPRWALCHVYILERCGQCNRTHNRNNRNPTGRPHLVSCLDISACLQENFCCGGVTSMCCIVKGSVAILQDRVATFSVYGWTFHHFTGWIWLPLLLSCVSSFICITKIQC